MNPTRKELEILYSWSEFYRKNKREEDFKKTEKQIKEFKSKNNLR